MAVFIKTPSNAYVHISQIELAYVGNDPDTPAQFAIWVMMEGQGYVVRQGFATAAAAQTALDNAITNLGGSV